MSIAGDEGPVAQVPRYQDAAVMDASGHQCTIQPRDDAGRHQMPYPERLRRGRGKIVELRCQVQVRAIAGDEVQPAAEGRRDA